MMGNQIIRDDGWEPIPDVEPQPMLQPTAKAHPLRRPVFDVQPRLPVELHVSAAPVPGSSTMPRSGPRLTIADSSASTPAPRVGYAPFRHSLMHHVSQMDHPYDRIQRTEYHPLSLQMRSNAFSTSEEDQAGPQVPALCRSTEHALPCPPLQKGGIPAVRKPLVQTSTSIQLTRSKGTSENKMLVEQFSHLLEVFGNSSAVYTSLVASPYAEEHRKRLLDSYAATTVFRYLQAVQKFIRVTNSLGLNLHELSESQLADALQVMQQSRSCDTDSDVPAGNFTIKALRWCHKIAGVTTLQICFSPLVDNFLKTKLTRDKREAPPLPLWLIFHWERRVLQSVATNFEIMMLGSFLLITWAGLRFADAQRLNVHSLVFNFQELRGMVWRSKTMSSGHPFGVQSAGLCSTGTFTWLLNF